jgi:hypothetical protein
MEVRTVIVPFVPVVSTAPSSTRVSVRCEPWNIPDAPKPTIAKTNYADRTQPDVKILSAMREGHNVFDHIVTAAFGTRNGKVDKIARETLRTLMAKGAVSRFKATHINGQPYIWSIEHAN